MGKLTVKEIKYKRKIFKKKGERERGNLLVKDTNEENIKVIKVI